MANKAVEAIYNIAQICVQDWHHYIINLDFMTCCLRCQCYPAYGGNIDTMSMLPQQYLKRTPIISYTPKSSNQDY